MELEFSKRMPGFSGPDHQCSTVCVFSVWASLCVRMHSHVCRRAGSACVMCVHALKSVLGFMGPKVYNLGVTSSSRPPPKRLCK